MPPKRWQSRRPGTRFTPAEANRLKRNMGVPGDILWVADRPGGKVRIKAPRPHQVEDPVEASAPPSPSSTEDRSQISLDINQSSALFDIHKARSTMASEADDGGIRKIQTRSLKRKASSALLPEAMDDTESAWDPVDEGEDEETQQASVGARTILSIIKHEAGCGRPWPSTLIRDRKFRVRLSDGTKEWLQGSQIMDKDMLDEHVANKCKASGWDKAFEEKMRAKGKFKANYQ